MGGGGFASEGLGSVFRVGNQIHVQKPWRNEQRKDAKK